MHRSHRPARARSRSRKVVAAVACGMLLSACATAEVTDDAHEAGPIRIGVIADLTGPFTVYGTSLARSAELAVEEINSAGGIGGRPVEMIIEDIQTDVAVTVDRARSSSNVTRSIWSSVPWDPMRTMPPSRSS